MKNNENATIHAPVLSAFSLPALCICSPCFAIQVSRLAGVLVKNGVRKGDLVVIYMPMVPQAMFAMLACARIGAPHSLIFGGFAAKELSVRISHAKVRSCDSIFGALKSEQCVKRSIRTSDRIQLSPHRRVCVFLLSRSSW